MNDDIINWDEIDKSIESTKGKAVDAEQDAQERTEKFQEELEARTEANLNGAGGFRSIDKPRITKPADWMFYQQGGKISYVDITLERFSLQVAEAINGQIPQSEWEHEIGPDGNVKMVANKPSLIMPSRSLLRRPSREIHVIGCDPLKPKLYKNDRGEMVFNTWQPFCAPAVPDEEYEKIVPLVDEWLSLIFPSWKEWLLDAWAHQYQKLTEKANFAVVLGSRIHGTGKDFLLHIATWAFSEQGMKSDVNFTEFMETQYTEWLESPIIVVGEFYEPGQKQALIINRVKSIAAAPPEFLAVSAKFKPRKTVRNIHRLWFTTNHPERYPMEEYDRRSIVINAERDEPEIKDTVINMIDRHIGKGNALSEFINNGGGAAFYHWLMARDISEFNPKEPPRELKVMVDDGEGGMVEDLVVMEKVQLESNQTLVEAMIEISTTFETWCGKFYMSRTEEYRDGDMSKFMPLFVTSKQIRATKAMFFSDDDLRRPGRGRAAQALLDSAMLTMGYLPVKYDKKGQAWSAYRGEIWLRDTRVYLNINMMKMPQTAGKLTKLRKMANEHMVKIVEWIHETEDGAEMWGRVDAMPDAKSKGGF